MTVTSLVAGTKIAAMYDYLKREMVGDSMVIAGDQFQHIADELKLTKSVQVYGLLQQLDKKGLINRKRRSEEGEEGFVISFSLELQDKDQPKKIKCDARRSTRPERCIGSSSKKLDDLIATLQVEIDVLKESHNNKVRVYNSLVAAKAAFKE